LHRRALAQPHRRSRPRAGAEAKGSPAGDDADRGGGPDREERPRSRGKAGRGDGPPRGRVPDPLRGLAAAGGAAVAHLKRAELRVPASLTSPGGSCDVMPWLLDSSFSRCPSRCDEPAMMIGRKRRLSTGVKSSAAVESENPTDTARFASITSISPRESIASR